MEIESNYGRRMGGMGRRGIGGLSRGMNSRMAMGRPAYPTPPPGVNFDLPSRPMGMQDPMGGYQPAPPPRMGGYGGGPPPQASTKGSSLSELPAQPAAAGMDWPPQNTAQPVMDPRQQQEMMQQQQAFNDARVSMPAGQQFQPPREQAPLINQAPQFDPRMIQRTDMPSAPRELPGYATPLSAPPPPQQFDVGPQIGLQAPQGPTPFQNISRPLGQPQPLGG